MKRWRDLLLAAHAPLALRHALVEGHVPRIVHESPPERREPARAVPRRADARVVRLFAVQIR